MELIKKIIMNKHTIELGFEELCLIERALEMYGRVGMLQFDYLTMCNSLGKLIWDRKKSEEFRKKADELKAVFDYPPNANPGIFNTEIVSDDCRIAIDMYKTIRYQRYLDRYKENPEEESKHYGVDQSPADICQIAGMKTPDFKITTISSLDLNELECKLDEALDKETPESLNEWLNKKTNE